MTLSLPVNQTTAVGAWIASCVADDENMAVDALVCAYLRKFLDGKSAIDPETLSRIVAQLERMKSQGIITDETFRLIAK